MTCFCKGNQGCRLFLGYIQSNWVDEKWQRHKSPESDAADSEHVISPVPGGRVLSLLIPDHTLAMTSEKVNMPLQNGGNIWNYQYILVKHDSLSLIKELVLMFLCRILLNVRYFSALLCEAEKSVQTYNEDEEHDKLINWVKLNHCYRFVSKLTSEIWLILKAIKP